MSVLPLLTVATVVVLALFTQGTQGRDGDLIAETFIVVDYKGLERYLPENDNDVKKAKESLLKDVYYFVTDSNEYYDTLRQYDLNMQIAVVDVQVLDHDIEHIDDIIDGNTVIAEKSLKGFGRFLDSDEADKKSGDYDLAVLLSGYNYKDPVAGLAQLGTVCEGIEARAVVELTATAATVPTFVHEVAHVLGADHDPAGTPTIMSPEQSHAEDPLVFAFSKLSAGMILMNLKKEGKTCLSKTASTSKVPDITPQKYTGKLQDVNTMCARAVRPSSTVCTSNHFYGDIPEVTGDTLCYWVSCRDGANSCKKVKTSDGMPCAHGKSCKKGKCIDDVRPATEKVATDCVFGDDRIAFGSTCAKQIEKLGPSRCSVRKELGTTCCESCKNLTTGNPACPWGEAATVLVNGERISCKKSAELYSKAWTCTALIKDCCETCVPTGKPNCKWGEDKQVIVNGRPYSCPAAVKNYGRAWTCSSFQNQCCETCVDTGNPKCKWGESEVIRVNGKFRSCEATAKKFHKDWVCSAFAADCCEFCA